MFKKLIMIFSPIIIVIFPFFLLVVIIAGIIAGKSFEEDKIDNMRSKTNVINNQIYADTYTELLDKHLIEDGYVSLERLVFYLQRVNNILDTSTLSFDVWEEAYLKNLDIDEKQMIPIKTICKQLKKDDTLPEFTVENGTNNNGIQIDVIDLCNDNGEDITTSKEYDESIYTLPFSFPLKTNFTVSSYVFKHRTIDFKDGEEPTTDFHSGWDFSVPIGTNFYSICNGIVTNITNTQNNDLPYGKSGNKTGNYMNVKCNNGFIAIYHHLQYHSQPLNIRVGSIVRVGDLLGRTSTTGKSTGPHLHLGLKDEKGTLLDAMLYVDLKSYRKVNLN